MSVELLNIDCMEYMKGLPDKAFDLAIVDPPYGVNINHSGGRGKGGWKSHERKGWDKEKMSPCFFEELFRVSKDQIVWGGNYYTKCLPSSMGWVVWDKAKYAFTTSDAELAYTSFDCKLRVFSRMVNMDKGFMNKDGGDIHPTQKPVALYKWLLTNYAKEGDKILDTHLGSGSSAIAAHQMGFDFVGTEIDKDYYDAACKRFREQTMQQDLFKQDRHDENMDN